jgi:hypothetical protein
MTAGCLHLARIQTLVDFILLAFVLDIGPFWSLYCDHDLPPR